MRSIVQIGALGLLFGQPCASNPDGENERLPYYKKWRNNPKVCLGVCVRVCVRERQRESILYLSYECADLVVCSFD